MKQMKHLKLLLTALLLAALAIPVLVACGEADDVEDGKGTTGSELVLPGGEETLPAVTVGELMTDLSDFTLKTGDAVLEMTVKDDDLYVTQFSTKESGINRAAEDGLSFSLPSQYVKNGKGTRFAWKYVGYMHLRGETEYQQYGYALRFADKKAGMTYDLHVTAHFRFDGPFEFTGYLKNENQADVTIKPSAYFRVSTKGETAPDAWTFNKESGVAEGYTIKATGQQFPGSGIYKQSLLDGAVTAQNNTNQDHNQGGQIPMMYIDYETWGQYYALEWTNGTISANEGEEAGSCNVLVRLGDDTWSPNFETKLPAGDTFYLPTVYMGIYEGDVEVGSNQFKRWFLYNKAPDILLEDPNEPLVQQDMQIGLEAAKYGIEAIKWDYGWWSNEPIPGTSWRTNEGLLEVHNDAYLGVLSGHGAKNLGEFAKMVKQKNMTLTMYVLTKDSQVAKKGVPTSVGPDAHPEWFSNRVVTGVGASADFGNVDCVEFFKGYLFNFFKESGVTTWRSDFEPICRESNKANRHAANGSDVQYWCSVGFYDIVDYLYDNLDYFRYESCCSGGAMKDFSTMRRAVILNCDDSADFQSLKMSFYDSSYCIHPAQLQLPTNAGSYTAGNVRYAGFGDHDYGLRSQMVGAVMLSNWEGTKPADMLSWTRHMQTYKTRVRPLIKHGDLYHVLPRPDGVNWDGFFYFDEDAASSTKGLLMIFKPSKQAGDTEIVKLRGLDPDTLYSVEYQDHTELNTKIKGSDLMNHGLKITFTEDCTSDWVWIVEP